MYAVDGGGKIEKQQTWEMELVLEGYPRLV
jgi:hypothetical protein